MARLSTKNSPRARRAAFPFVAFVVLCTATPCAWSAIVIEGTDASDVIDVSSSSMAHDIRGRGDDDRLTGSSAADAIDGGYGYDRVQGGDGADLLIGGPGNDIIDGGAGTDDARYAKSPREPRDHWHHRRLSDTRALGQRRHRHVDRRRVRGLLGRALFRCGVAFTPGKPLAGRRRRLREHATRSVGGRRGARQRHGRRRGRSGCDFRGRPRAWHGDGARRRIGDVCACCRIRWRRQLRLYGVRRTRRHRYGERVDHGVPLVGRRRAQEPHRRGARGELAQGQPQSLRGRLDAAAATRARQWRATRRSSQDHHRLELDDLGSEPPSPHHLGRRSRQLCRQ